LQNDSFGVLKTNYFIVLFTAVI